MSKKTALYMACEELSKRTSCPKIYHNMDCKGCIGIVNQADCWVKYFQQQADIPDGWDVVREIYEDCQAEIKIFNNDVKNDVFVSDYERGIYERNNDICELIEQVGIMVGEIQDISNHNYESKQIEAQNRLENMRENFRF